MRAAELPGKDGLARLPPWQTMALACISPTCALPTEATLTATPTSLCRWSE